jgi:hypothetical protein
MCGGGCTAAAANAATEATAALPAAGHGGIMSDDKWILFKMADGQFLNAQNKRGSGYFPGLTIIC